MRRLLLVPVLLLGFTSAAALGADDHPTTHKTRAAAVGTIAALSTNSITVHGGADLTCRLAKHSPSLVGFALGDRVKVACGNGKLTHIGRVKLHDGTPTTTASAKSKNGGDQTTTPLPATTGSGKIVTLTATSIVVTGDRTVSCTIGTSSPPTAGFHVGDSVKLGCLGGLLTFLAKATDGATTTNTTGTTTTASSTGTLTALSATSVTVTGDRALTCTIGTSSPATGEFHVGDAVKMGCVNGVLYALLRTTTAPAPTSDKNATTTTTSTPTTVNTYGVGTITSLSATTIGVTGDNTLKCELASSSPSVAGFAVGDHVKIACQGYLLVGIVKTDAPATTTTTTTTPAVSTTTTTASNNTYGIGTISALSATSVTVTGDHTATCAISPTGASPADYHLGIGSHVTIACTNGVVTHISV